MLLFTTTLFQDLPEINCFGVINFRDQALSTPVFLLQLYGKYWLAARNNHDNEAFTNPVQISRTRIKVAFQNFKKLQPFYLLKNKILSAKFSLFEYKTCPLTFDS